MKQHLGLWFPDHEEHMIEWCSKNGEMVDGKTSYQLKKLRAALAWCPVRRTAVDVGGHIGTWAMHLAKVFDCVQAFEPIQEHRDCFILNVGPAPNVFLSSFALGAEPGRVALTIPRGSSGGTHISGPGDIEVRTLDSCRFGDVDFLKIDCEGYELAVLQGAVETLKRCKPTIICEQKSHTPGGQKHIAPGQSQTPAVDFLKTLGYEVKQVLSGDYILVAK